MKTQSQNHISLFGNAFADEPDQAIPLSDFLYGIKEGAWGTQVAALRRLIADGNREKYDDKKRKLPAASLSVHCLSRERDLTFEQKEITHSGWLQADFDLKDNPILAEQAEAKRRDLLSDPYVHAVFLGPSGEGLKAVVAIPAEYDRHKAAWLAAEVHFRNVHGLNLDKSTKDPMRLCFASHDPDLAISEDFKPIPVPEAQPSLAPVTTTTRAKGDKSDLPPPTAEEIAKMLSHIPPRPDYETWLKIASAVWSELPMLEGAQILHEWSPEEKDGEYASKHKARLQQIGIGTLIHIAKENGYRPYRHSVVKLAKANGSQNSAELSEDYHANDAGRAELFVARWQNEIRYIPDRETWLAWEDGRWRIDNTGALHRRAIALSKEMLSEAANLPGNDEHSNKMRVEAIRRALSWGNQSTITPMLSLAKSLQSVHLAAAELDADPWVVGCQNAILNLVTGIGRPYTPSDFICQTLGCNLDPGATCPTWDRFLTDIFPDSDVLTFVQKAVGYSLSGSMKEQVFFFLYGHGSNGKSTFLSVITKLMGDYAARAGKALTATNDRGDYPLREAAGIAGKRFVTGSETSEREKLNIAVLKDITGGERMRAANLYENAFEFQPTCKLWFAGNHKPSIADTSAGAWRRVRLIPFTRQFAPHERDRELEGKLLKELPGILNWASEGCALWMRDGLTPPPAIAKAVDDYRGEEDILADFIDEVTSPASGATTPHPALFSAYQQWTHENGIRFSLTSKLLAKRLRDRGWKDRRSGSCKVLWVGVSIL
jgi:P4 family phage/plasmid primase-like protien